MTEPVRTPSLRSAREELDEDRFAELVIYIAGKLQDDPSFGDTKLNKTLCFCDFTAFATLGHTITGAQYHRQPRGPLARPLPRIRDELIAAGDVTVEMKKVYTHSRRVTTPTREADPSVFSHEELEIIDDVIRQVRPHNATSISEVSHRIIAGWTVLDDGETIPPETLFVDTAPFSADERALAGHLAAKHAR
ncbi:Panacea domain-containing protein [Paraconexibacter antarcticus]|uniref:Panacea domain-containing protein n=1 Tax=Paraconexibacter antarcticus TaxID=2949664 RepID=A0ABY5DM54_9ACTN|nr:Panacea domain-containing protein [Paraconexibacter antarcticus]UTI62629.1 Panacea domain-containing protein [Paraconexibacter antarcticus]